MDLSETELPSNKKFGFFFTIVSAIAAVYFYKTTNLIWLYTTVSASLIFLIISLLKDELLSPLNKLWMRFGLLLSRIVSPIVLGLIFFGLFTPVAIFMRLRGRDELRIKLSKKASHWALRETPNKLGSFKHQF